MASSADLDSWRALGGKVTEVKKRKRFVSPTGDAARNLWPSCSCDAVPAWPEHHILHRAGEEYTSWQAASEYLKTKGNHRQTRCIALGSSCNSSFIDLRMPMASNLGCKTASMMTCLAYVRSEKQHSFGFKHRARFCWLAGNTGEKAGKENADEDNGKAEPAAKAQQPGSKKARKGAASKVCTSQPLQVALAYSIIAPQRGLHTLKLM